MRITNEEKGVTRERILKAAYGLFLRKGFRQSTTRDIAKAAKIGTGTLFNYFDSKDAIGCELVLEAFRRAEHECQRTSFKGAPPEERTFAFVASVLANLRPHKEILRELLPNIMMSLLSNFGDEPTLAKTHLDILHKTVLKRVAGTTPVLITQHYLSLFAGVLIFWLRDSSRSHEMTLALLDESLEIFFTSFPDFKGEKHVPVE